VHDIFQAAPPLHLAKTTEKQKKLSSQCLKGKRRITLNSTLYSSSVGSGRSFEARKAPGYSDDHHHRSPLTRPR
jgi:hypothetical protein